MEMTEIELYGYVAIVAKHDDGIWRVGMSSGPNFISLSDGSEIGRYRMFLAKLEANLYSLNRKPDQNMIIDDVQKLIIMQESDFDIRIGGYGVASCIEDDGSFLGSFRCGNLYDVDPSEVRVYQQIDWSGW